jgi:demethylmenaquinone methyltransferase/2-methoxy-6-polyprenyl-1,4-benzoquinol methylase
MLEMKRAVNDPPFDDDVFDWAWAMGLVSSAPLEPLPLVQELARVVRPGGSVAIQKDVRG